MVRSTNHSQGERFGCYPSERGLCFHRLNDPFRNAPSSHVVNILNCGVFVAFWHRCPSRNPGRRAFQGPDARSCASSTRLRRAEAADARTASPTTYNVLTRLRPGLKPVQANDARWNTPREGFFPATNRALVDLTLECLFLLGGHRHNPGCAASST